MPSLIDLRRRIRAVKSTQQITKAMKMIAASRLKRAQDRVVAARPFAQRMRRVLNSLVSRVEQDAHPLLRIPAPGGRSLLIVVTADRGLCGSFNSNVLKAAGQFIVTEGKDHQVALGLIGRKGRDFFRRSGMELIADFPELGDFPNFEDVRPIARLIIDDFVAGRVDQVFIGYQRFINAAVQRPTTRQLLPIVAPAGAADDAQAADFIFEPSPEELLATLLPRFVEMQVYEAVLEARASEQSARMVAMRQATDAAKEMVSDLTLAYNKARQENITGELLDIVGGKAAVENA